MTAATRSLQAATSMTRWVKDRDVTFAPRPTTTWAWASEDHHHYRDGQQRRASGKDATETTEENTVLGRQRASGPTVLDGTVSYQLVDDVTEGSLTSQQRWQQLHVHSRRLRWLASGVKIETWPSHTPRPTTTQAWARPETITITTWRAAAASRQARAKDAASATEEKHGTERRHCRRHGCGRYGKLPVGWWCDRRQLDVQRWRQLHVHSRQRLRWLASGSR